MNDCCGGIHAKTVGDVVEGQFLFLGITIVGGKK